MDVRIINIILIVGLSLLTTACGGDEGGGNGNRKASVTPDLSGAREVAVGNRHSCAVLKTGKLLCWGENENGKLGDGTTRTRRNPVAVNLGDDGHAIEVSLGERHSCAILSGGAVVCWGDNTFGQLGDGTNNGSNTPVSVNLGENRSARSISLGNNYSCALLDDGSVKCWGINISGQLGDGGGLPQNAPVSSNLGDGVKARAISNGAEHTCIITTDNRVLCWGGNYYGSLGNGATAPSLLTPVEALLGDGRFALAIEANAYHTCALLDDNSLKCWGINEYGQLGVGADSNQICTVATTDIDCIKTPTTVDLGQGRSARGFALGYYHACAHLDDNSVKCWGRNHFGQLGDKTNLNRETPVTTDLGERVVVGMSAGTSSSCALFEDGSVTCWGSNEHGQLGTGEGLSVLSPREVDTGDEKITAIDGGLGHSCAFFEDEDSNTNLKCWGESAEGQSGGCLVG